MIRKLFLCLVLALACQPTIGAEESSGDLPKVVLIGDSIRLSYTHTVETILNDKAVIVSPKANGQDSENLLKHLDEWVIEQQPQFVHFNCGIHDSKKSKADGTFQVSLNQYEKNLREIVQRSRDRTDAVVLFATTTPILDDRAATARSERDYELLGSSITRFNAVATRVMDDLNVPVNDLHGLLSDNEVSELIGQDGVHLVESGNQLAGTRVAAFLCQHFSKADALRGPWKINEWKRIPEHTWLARDQPIRSLTYRNEIYQDHATDVFAFYATPGSVHGDPSLDHNLPAVVLIHGGGGTAFADWVWLWAKRGYAAIAMDLSGRRPQAPQFDSQTGELISNLRTKRTRLPNGGPEADRVSKFENSGGDLSDDWQPHAVAAVMRAHSLIAGFPEIDAERTAVTGISWGGYMTCLVASLDDRFKAAVPVYGCGFLFEGESVQKPFIDALPPEQRGRWICNYDPSMWLPQCKVPMLFVNGTNDKHYPLNSYMRSFGLVPGAAQLRIEVAMRHGHLPGWTPPEIGWFIDQHVNQGISLPVLHPLKTSSGIAKAQVDSTLPIQSASLHFTTDTGKLVDRKWQSTRATINDSQVAATVPADASSWMLSVTDQRGAMVSTGVQLGSGR